MAQPSAPQFPEPIMIFVLYRYYGQSPELSLKPSLNCKVAWFPFIFKRSGGWFSMLGFSMFDLCLNALLRQLCTGDSSWHRGGGSLVGYQSVVLVHFYLFWGTPSHFSGTLAVPLVGRAGPSLAGAYLCARLSSQDSSTTSILFI